MEMTRRNLLALSAAALAPRWSRAASNDPVSWTLKGAADALAKKSISSVELTKACLDRIAKYDAGLNTFITITADHALEAARRMDAERASGKTRSPLHGIPLALKDNIDTAGIRTTAASALFADRIPTEDAEVWRRLREGGSVLLGKLNLHEFANGGTTAISYFGPVRNPWAPDRNCGGSSGGSAVAVIADFCFGSLGTDTGGSVRTPASFCGMVGFKPTHGRSSIRGIIPLVWSLDHVGPMTKTVEDAALMLDLMAGYDELDLDSVDHPVGSYAKAIGAPVRNFRLGVPRALFYDRVDPEVMKAVEAAIAELKKVTASLKDVVLPQVAFGGGLGGAEMAAYHKPWYSKSSSLYQIPTRNNLKRASEGLAVNYVEAIRNVRMLRRSVAKVFADVDLLITPTTKLKPYPIEEAIKRAESERASPPTLANTSPFNVFGLPTISIPCGQFADGIPIGLQITGAPWAEDKVLALAHAYERATEWHKRRPILDSSLKPYEVKPTL